MGGGVWYTWHENGGGRIGSDKPQFREALSMVEFSHRRAVVLWLRRLLSAALSCLAAAVIAGRWGGEAVYTVGAGPSLLSWLHPSALFCLLAMAAGTSVFGSLLLEAGCMLDGAAFGLVCALMAEGRFVTARPMLFMGLTIPLLILRAGLCAAVQAGAERMLLAYGRGDEVGFRAALGSGCAASLTSAGCVLAASALLRLAAG